MKKSLTATIAMAKQPNETMTQALHRLRNSGESITETAARLAKGDIDAEVITAPENPTTATGDNPTSTDETKTEPVKATMTPAKKLKLDIKASGTVEKAEPATKPKAKTTVKKKTTTETKPKAKTTAKKKTTKKDD